MFKSIYKKLKGLVLAAAMVACLLPLMTKQVNAATIHTVTLPYEATEGTRCEATEGVRCHITAEDIFGAEVASGGDFIDIGFTRPISDTFVNGDISYSEDGPFIGTRGIQVADTYYGEWNGFYLYDNKDYYFYAPSAGTYTFTAFLGDAMLGGAEEENNENDYNVTITVTGNNNAPTDITLSSTTIAAASTGINAVVGTLSSTDSDVGNTFTYSLVSGTGDTNNTSFNISSSSLRTNGTLAAGSYSVRIRTTDSGNATYDKVFTITVYTVPTITTQAVTNIDTTTATGNGNITDFGMSNPTAYGLVWNTTGSPNTADSKIDKGAVSSTGSFTGSMTGLAPNTTYYVRSYATNTAGTSYGNEVNFKTVTAVPGAPTIGTASAGNGQATVSFTAPTSNGGASITGYTVTSSGGQTGTGSASPIVVTGLTNGIAYTFKVTATNSAGTGSSSASSNSVTPKGVQTITFAQPANYNFDTSPTLVATSTSGLTVSFSSSNTSVATITSGGYLTFIKAGTATINADQAGNSTYEAAPTVTRSFTVNAVAPEAPTIGTATDGDGQALVTFSAPVLDGGAAISGYTVTSSGGQTATGSVSPITVTGLTNGTAYTFTVTATNSAGTSSASSASNSVTPKGPQTITFVNPGAQNFGTLPVLTATSTSGLPVTFSSSTTGVATITSDGHLTFVSAGTATINADQAGNSAYLAAPTVTRSFTVNAVVPGAPVIGTATAGDGQASISFTAPISTGGAAIIGYTVTSSGGQTGTGASSPISVSGLTNGTAYTFTVTATNYAGTSPSSAQSNSVTPKAAQTITFANPGAQNFGTTPTLMATSTSGLTVDFTSEDTSVCTITSGGNLTFLKSGTAVITAHQAGNSTYLAANDVTQSFGVNAVVPGAPIIGTATAEDGQATVSFTAPTFTGGDAISGYTVTANPGGITAAGAGSPITITGLTNGTEYTFTVAATNSVGTGPSSSASNSVMAYTNSQISPTAASFDKKTSAQADIAVTMTLNGNTLTSINNGSNQLIPDTDYTVSGNTVTILKSYMANQPVGTTTLTFNFSTGNTKSLAITVSSGLSVVTYKNNYSDADVTDYTTQSVVSGNKAIVPTQPTRSGYTFGGWYTEKAYTTAWNFKNNTVADDTILYAKWVVEQIPTYTVIYVGDGATSGSVPIDNSAYISDTTVKVKANTGSLAKAGYTFEGWSCSGTTYKAGQTFTISGDVTLTAVWTAVPETYTATYNYNYANGGIYTTQTNIVSGSTLIAPSEPSRTGYSFIGWYKDNACVNLWNFNTDTIKANVNLHAKWAANTYTVSGTVVDEGAATVSGATVKVIQGNVQFGGAATTDSNGNFTITGVPDGIYNLVVTKDAQEVTVCITVSGGNYTYTGSITLPSGNKNSKLDVIGTETPNIVVDNLNNVFGDSNVYNSSDEDTVTDGGTVEIKLTVQKNDNSTNKATVEAAMSSGGYTSGTVLDVDMTKATTTSSGVSQESSITATSNLIKIIIPLPAELQGKTSYVIYRAHDYGSGIVVDSISTTVNPTTGEYIEVSSDKTQITAYLKYFSTYAIAYLNQSTSGSGSSFSASSIQSYIMDATATTGGNITPNGSINATYGESKTYKITADKNYYISDVLVDGKSVGAVESYTFSNINATHTIKAEFDKITGLPYYIGENGSKVFIGFAADVDGTTKYIAPEGKDVKFIENSKSFADITKHWAKPYIDFVTQREIFLGTSSNAFSPNKGMTRAMFATVIGRVYERSYGEIKTTGSEKKFTDVNYKEYYGKYVDWAAENNIISGVEEDKLEPNREITREEMAVILYRMAKFLNSDTKESEASQLSYPDASDISLWALDAAKYCQQTGIISGRDGGNFVPKGTATRAEVAVILQRFIENIVSTSKISSVN